MYKKYVLLIAIVLISISIVPSWNTFYPQKYVSKTEKEYTTREEIAWRVSRLSYEYVPKYVATRISKDNTTELAINEDMIPTKPFSVASGNMRVLPQQITASYQKYQVTVLQPGIFQLNTYAFPGWIVTIDGKEVSYKTNSISLMQVAISKGQHSIIAQFSNTRVRTIGNTISMITALGLVVIVCIRLLKR